MFKTIMPLSAILSLRFLGLFLVLPVLSIYAMSMEGATPLLVGVIVGGYALTQALFQVPFGTISDKIGRKPTLFVGLLIFLLPALMVFAFLVLGIINLLLALLVSFIAFLLFKLSHYNIKYGSLLKTALYATTILLLLEIILIYLYPIIIWLAMLLYILLFLFASWSIAQKRFAIKRHKQKEYPEKK